MAIPTDRVRPLVQESTVTGGNPAEEQEYPLPLDPNEDAPEVQGIFYQPPSPSTTRDETTYHTRDADDNLVAKDAKLETESRLVDQVFVRHSQDRNVTIPAGFTWVRHDLIIESGVEITIEDGAELLLI
jgi:hypothetical protein